MDFIDPTDLTIQHGVLDYFLEDCNPSLPDHVAIIMDGNGRWAQKLGKPRIEGHAAGAHALRRAIECCRYLGIPRLTVFAFSTENWSRPKDEVEGLMHLFMQHMISERESLIRNQVSLKFFGQLHQLSDDLQQEITKIEQDTSSGAKLRLQIALSYGSREEILYATRRIASQVQQGKLSVKEIDEVLFSSFLFTHDSPDPDLLIRTSGEFRVSNFLLWQIAYTELWITDVLWPDFDEEVFVQALSSYTQRERRFGKTSAQL